MHYAASVEEEKLKKLPRDKPDTCTSSAFDFLLFVWITIAWLNSRHSAKYSIKFKDATENRELGGERSGGEETRTRKGKCLGNVMRGRRLFSEAFHQNPKNRAKLTLLFFFFLSSFTIYFLFSYKRISRMGSVGEEAPVGSCYQPSVFRSLLLNKTAPKLWTGEGVGAAYRSAELLLTALTPAGWLNPLCLAESAVVPWSLLLSGGNQRCGEVAWGKDPDPSSWVGIQAGRTGRSTLI